MLASYTLDYGQNIAYQTFKGASYTWDYDRNVDIPNL